MQNTKLHHFRLDDYDFQTKTPWFQLEEKTI